MEQGRVYSHFLQKNNLIIPRKEILRYMSCKNEDESVKELIDKFLPVVTEALNLKGSFVCLPLEHSTQGVFVSGVHLNSQDLKKNLKNCSMAVVFALTCGINIDLLIKKHSALSPLQAFCVNAIATASIEGYADEFCREISDSLKKDGLFTRPRFSPGYGDLNIENQIEFLRFTNAQRLLGITLTEKYMMMPSKSVTAIMGAGIDKCIPTGTNCSICTLKNCKFKGA